MKKLNSNLCTTTPNYPKTHQHVLEFFRCWTVLFALQSSKYLTLLILAKHNDVILTALVFFWPPSGVANTSKFAVVSWFYWLVIMLVMQIT